MRLWRALENVYCWSGVRSVWREHMGDELQFLEPLLRPMEELALSVPWPGTVEGRRVVIHDEDDIVAVDRETSEASPIAREDIVLWKLDAETLFKGVSAALGLAGSPSSVGMGNRLWWLGELIIVERVFPVYLATTKDAADLLRSTAHIAALAKRPFVLATPSRSGGSADLDNLLAGCEAAWMTLDAVLEWLGEGAFRLRAPITDLLRAFLERHAPARRTTDDHPRFPTPRGATWADVSIRFLGAESVHVVVRGEVRELDPAGMNLQDRRTKKPNLQWQLLRVFGLAGGRIFWRDGNASRDFQKRKETLAKSLSAFFGIDDDPFALEGKDWRCRFRVAASEA
ncbi:MAG: hypothetical protein KF678_15605 [Phycisphaeraceae bacterium]|nr:hypothetical protein [Phycisphaeraceae bacterium]